MSVATAALACASEPEADEFLAEVRAALVVGRLAPYLGPGIFPSDLKGFPRGPKELADALGRRVALPRRARGNLSAAAQYIETKRHRRTLLELVANAFEIGARVTPFHWHLASLPLPLIVDTWYDSSFRSALQERHDWIEIQGASRHEVNDRAWTRAFSPRGEQLEVPPSTGVATVLYKPYGALIPARNIIISDSDFVEALTEIDIQTPIPALVQERRRSLGFIFIGCRFDDQTSRTYARQIVKRSGGSHYCIVDPHCPSTRNEQRFYRELGVRVLRYPLQATLEHLSQ